MDDMHHTTVDLKYQIKAIEERIIRRMNAKDKRDATIVFYLRTIVFLFIIYLILKAMSILLMFGFKNQ